MDEKTKAEIYLTYLDRILAGEKNIEPVEDVEIAKLLQLAETMIAADFSVNSKTRETLKKQLLAQVTKENKSNLTVLSKNDDDLDEEDLDYVVAGFSGQVGEQMDICPRCGSRSKKQGGKCSLCGL